MIFVHWNYGRDNTTGTFWETQREKEKKACIWLKKKWCKTQEARVPASKSTLIQGNAWTPLQIYGTRTAGVAQRESTRSKWFFTLFAATSLSKPRHLNLSTTWYAFFMWIVSKLPYWYMYVRVVFCNTCISFWVTPVVLLSSSGLLSLHKVRQQYYTCTYWQLKCGWKEVPSVK